MEDNSRQARAERTRQSLVIAARHAFSEKGYQATTVSSITAAADVAHGTFYLYFSNKEELFVELVEAAWTELYDEAFAGEASSPGTYDPGGPASACGARSRSTSVTAACGGPCSKGC